MLNFLILFIVVVNLIAAIVAYYIKEKYTYVTDHQYPPFTNTHKWGNRILTLLIIFSVVGAFVFSYTEVYLFIAIALLMIQHGFSAFMKYKYEREDKEYLINFVWMISSFVILVGFLFFTLPIKTIDDVTQINPDEIERLEMVMDVWDGEEIHYHRGTIEDKQTIDTILSELSKVEFRNNLFDFEKQDGSYDLTIRNSDYYFIRIYEDYLTIDFEDYKVVGENNLYRMLEESDIDWENLD
ncbi:protein of unknown function [Oceanobacillus limi]|uniref:DUF4181 domain-containing protein n=1 Tax=Oceanobacillus limi TaxID=930131 RepID=A0A1H9Y0H3_9BACI|nr:DUF4181 domain-containing protein [Oceanobacillus limi]SES62217.1 protein of unknown function [Oceanobacillus limi]